MIYFNNNRSTFSDFIGNNVSKLPVEVCKRTVALIATNEDEIKTSNIYCKIKDILEFKPRLYETILNKQPTDNYSLDVIEEFNILSIQLSGNNRNKLLKSTVEVINLINKDSSIEYGSINIILQLPTKTNTKYNWFESRASQFLKYMCKLDEDNYYDINLDFNFEEGISIIDILTPSIVLGLGMNRDGKTKMSIKLSNISLIDKTILIDDMLSKLHNTGTFVKLSDILSFIDN